MDRRLIRKMRYLPVMVAFFIAGYLVGQAPGPSLLPSARAEKSAPPHMDLPDFSALAANLKPAVVYVIVSSAKDVQSSGLPKNHPNVSPDMKKSVGSGFVIDPDGFILTNNHVVDESKKVEVVLAGGKKYTAKVVGRDQQLDIALIKINAGKRLTELTLGDSNKAKTGQWVVAMGNPFGLENNVTVGVISGKGRELPEAPFVDFIQTDAAIYPGNSGGPLVDLDGNVIGINTAVVPGTQVGFSIPINRVKRILPQLRKGERVARGYIGVRMAPISRLPERAATEKGVLVVKTSSGGPAEKAGIRQNDVIIGYNGKSIANPNELAMLVDKSKPGQQAEVKVARSGSELTVTLTVGKIPENLNR